MNWSLRIGNGIILMKRMLWEKCLLKREIILEILLLLISSKYNKYNKRIEMHAYDTRLKINQLIIRRS